MLFLLKKIYLCRTTKLAWSYSIYHALLR